MWWLIGIIVYLIVGYYFKTPDNWNWYQRILSGVLWFPMVALALITVSAYFGGGKLWQSLKK
jgi:ABC-type dipeptide/oligopeptide/nickel transport system permease subunit